MATALAVQRTNPYKVSDNFNLAKAIQLRYKNGLSLQEIADYFDIPKTTLDCRLNAVLRFLPDAEEVEMYRQNKAALLDALEWKVYVNMSDEQKLKDASFNNLAYGFQNICTQNRLEKGLATQIVDTVAIVGTIDDLRRREDEILKTVQARVVQDVVPAPNNHIPIIQPKGITD